MLVLFVALPATSASALHAATVPDLGLPEIAGPVDAGYRDFSYGSGTLNTPTGEKPQSKLWWNDGVWWGCLWDPAVGAHRIHRFDKVAHTWTSVGPNADNRTQTLVDVLWDGTRLYIASHVFDSSGEFRLHSYTYDAGTDTYTLRSGFPVVMGSGSAEALTLAKDTTGKLWITWEQSGDVMVNRSTSSETTWGSAFRLPVQGNDTSSDDISGVIAFGTRVGIMWSNQNDEKMYFATHVDGNNDTTWQAREEALANAALGNVADDHLNMALSFTTNPPTLFAATKTSLSGASTLPQIYLLRRSSSGTWSSYVAGDQDDGHTRPIVQVDDENRKVYIIARSDDGDNAIRVKVTDLDTLSLPSGPGTDFIQDLNEPNVNNPAGTKQTLNGTTDLLVIASDEVGHYYYHNTIDLPGAPSIPDIAVAPTSHVYGNVLLGGSSEQTFVVSNQGNASLQVTGTSLQGPNANQFAITSGGGSFSLAPGATRNVVVAFNPTSLGAKSCTLRFASNDPDEDPLTVALSGTGVQPDIAVNPMSHDYGSVLVGATVSQTFQVQNTGSSNLNVATTSLVGANPAMFAITSGGGAFALAPGATRDISIAYNPTSTGLATATLRLTSDDPDENPLDVALGGTGVRPDIAVTPTAQDYGSVLVGVVASQSIQVQNTGSSTLNVAAPSLTGVDSALFAITNGGGAFALAPGATRDIFVAFNPTSIGFKTAMLRLASDDPDENPLDVALSGTGVQPDIAVTPTAHDFGSVLVGSSAPQPFVVRNEGSSPLTAASPTLLGPDAADFSITSGGGNFVVAPADSHLVTVTFAPTGTGAKSATLQITSDDPDESPLDVGLSGTGALAETPDIAVTPTAHDFGSILVGGNAAQAFVVHNEGSATLGVTATALLGPNASDFSLTSGGGSFAVAPGDSHLVTVAFAPASTGAKSATLQITSDDPDESPLDVGLSGTGALPDTPHIAVTPTAHDFGSVPLGSNPAQSFAVHNAGNADLHVAAPALVGPDSTSFAITAGADSFIVAPGDSHVVSVTFVATTLGSKTAALRLTSDDPDSSSVDIALAGTAVQQDIAVDPGAHDYGPLTVGASAGFAFVVRNEGTDTLHVDSPTLAGTDAGDFVVTMGGEPFILAPVDSHTVMVTFTPASIGPKSAVLRLTSDDPDESPLDVGLSGTGALPDLPDIAVTPTAHDFGSVFVGSSAPQSFVVRNTGSAALAVTATTLLGSDVGAFSITSGGGNFVVAPGDSHLVTVSFAPASTGAKSAALHITSDDPDEATLDLPLAGNGVAPEIAVDPAAHDFGAVIVGDSTSHPFVVRNLGLTLLSVSATSLLGTNANDFAITSGAGPFAIAPGDSHQVVVLFAPTALGLESATLRITSDDADEGILDVALTGSGTQPDITVMPLAHDFGNVAVGDSVTQDFTVRNDGSALLSVASTTLQGKDANEFAIASGNAPFVVAPGDSHTVVVLFVPDHVDQMTARLRLTSDDPDESPFNVQLIANAVDPVADIAVVPTSYDFGLVALGTTPSHGFIVHNTGLVDLSLTATSILGPDAAAFSIQSGGTPAVLASGDSLTLVLQFAPTVVGPRSATLRLESDDPDENPLDVPLAGTGGVLAADVDVSPVAHDFGLVLLGTSASHPILVRNLGTAALDAAVSLLGADAVDFGFAANDSTFTVAPGDSHVVTLGFTPATLGTKSATLRLTSNDPDASQLDVALAGAGVQPDIATDAAALDFGAVRVASMASQTLRVRNVGSSTLALTTTELLGPDVAHFTLTGGGAASLAPGDSLDLEVHFAPAETGAKQTTLRLTSDDPDESSLDIALTGAGITPEIAVQPLFHAFSTLAVGDSAAQEIRVRNEGSAALQVDAVWLAGPDSTDFAVTSPGPFAVAPGDSLALVVRFAPLSAGNKLTTLHIENDDLDEDPVQVVLSGGAVDEFAPDLDAPATYFLGWVAVGASDSLTLTVGNTGMADLHVLSSVIVGPDSLDFALVSSGAFDLAPNTSGLLQIVFAPSALGTRQAILRITSDDPDESPWDIALQGTGGSPDIVVTPTEHDFGSVGVGSSATQTFQLSNQGTLSLHVTSTTFSGTSASEFAITIGGGTFNLAPGASRNLVVAFLPATTGPKSAALLIASNDPTSASTSLALNGIAVAAPVGTNAPQFAESASGSSAGTLTVSTEDSLAAASGHLYLAAVSTRALVDVTAVQGMGLVWSPVLAQCGANQTTGLEVWVGQGNPVPGTVSATFDTAPASAAILVCRYSGADLIAPLAASASANTAGISGTCTGGTDSAGYALPFATGADAAVVFTAVATGAGALTPGANWTQRSVIQTGAGGSECGVALVDRAVPTIDSLVVDGAFDVPEDWAVVALEIRAVDATTDVFPATAPENIDRATLRVRGEPGGRALQVELELPRATAVRLTLHDVRGHRLRTLFQGMLPAGRQQLPWADAHGTPGLATGIYFVRADLGDRVLSGKILLLH